MTPTNGLCVRPHDGSRNCYLWARYGRKVEKCYATPGNLPFYQKNIYNSSNSNLIHFKMPCRGFLVLYFCLCLSLYSVRFFHWNRCDHDFCHNVFSTIKNVTCYIYSPLQNIMLLFFIFMILFYLYVVLLCLYFYKCFILYYFLLQITNCKI